MAFDTTELREKRHKLLKDARAVLDKADEEKRNLLPEERQQYDKMFADSETMLVEIGDHERRNDLERLELAEVANQDDEKRTDKNAQDVEFYNPQFASDEYRSMFDKWLTHRESRMTDLELRVQTAGTGDEGGYLYASEQFVDTLIRNVSNKTVVRGMATQYRLATADSLGFPTLETEMTAGEWTSELGTPSAGSLVFGKRALHPHPLAKEVEVSKVLIRKVPNSVSLVNSELARVVAAANENGFINGDGVQKPLGFMVASNDGIPTSRDLSTGNTTSEVRVDNLKRQVGNLKEEYLANAEWLFHRTIITQISLLKDGNGRYLWQDSIAAGEPDRLLGYPVRRGDYMPSATTSGSYVGILGDFSNYWIVDAMDAQIARAEELLVRQNKDLFIIRMETDGAPVKSEAFTRVKLG